MRIFAGTARRRTIIAPKGEETRPTSDRVRESVFNALGSQGLIENATLLDLFAGTGALGLEALSRGAAAVTFVERDRAALEALRTNVETLGFEAESTIVPGDALRFMASTAQRFDVALLDPPYQFVDWDELLAAVPADVVVIERGRRMLPLGQEWMVFREKRFGSTVVQMARRDSGDIEPGDAEGLEHES